MKTPQIAIGLTILNLVILAYVLFRPSPAASSDVAPLVRARALEIVDDQGRVRAAIRVFPATNAKMPDGTTGYPETVLLRLGRNSSLRSANEALLAQMTPKTCKVNHRVEICVAVL